MTDYMHEEYDTDRMADNLRILRQVADKIDELENVQPTRPDRPDAERVQHGAEDEQPQPSAD